MYYRNTSISQKDRIEYIQYIQKLKPLTDVDTSIHFDSAFRSDHDPNADDFVIHLPSPMRNVVAISLSSCRFPNVSNLINDMRHSFSWSKIKSDGTDEIYIVNLQFGQYTITTLLNALIAKMNALDTNSIYVYTLDTSNNRLELQSWGGKQFLEANPFQFNTGDSFVTCSTKTPHALQLNQSVLIQGAVTDKFGPWLLLNSNWQVLSIIDATHFTISSDAITSYLTSPNQSVNGGGSDVVFYIEQPMKMIDSATSVMRSLGFPAHDSGLELKTCQLLRFQILNQMDEKFGKNVWKIQLMEEDEIPSSVYSIQSLKVVVMTKDRRYLEAHINNFKEYKDVSANKSLYFISFTMPTWPALTEIQQVILPFVKSSVLQSSTSVTIDSSTQSLQIHADYLTNKGVDVRVEAKPVNTLQADELWFQIINFCESTMKVFLLDSWTLCGPSLGYSSNFLNNPDKYVTALINDLYVHVCVPDLVLVNQINQMASNKNEHGKVQKRGIPQTNNVIAAIKLDSNPDSFVFIDQGNTNWLYLKRQHFGSNKSASLPTLDKIRLTLKSPRNQSMNLKNMNYSGVLTVRQALVI